jgi:hypothetical protein
VIKKYKCPSLFTGLLIFYQAVMEATSVCLILILFFFHINILGGETLALMVHFDVIIGENN